MNALPSAQISGQHVLTRVDNIFAKAYLNKQVSSRSSMFQKDVIKILAWSKRNLASLKTERIKGSINVQVDWLSRKTIQEGDWSLRKDLFQLITFHLDLLLMDLFASPCNHQLSQYFTRFFHPKVAAADALTFSA